MSLERYDALHPSVDVTVETRSNKRDLRPSRYCVALHRRVAVEQQKCTLKKRSLVGQHGRGDSTFLHSFQSSFCV